MPKSVTFRVLAAGLLVSGCCLPATAELHRPAAIAVAKDGVWIAEGSRGRVLLLGESSSPVNSTEVGRQISDLAAVPG